VDAGARCTRARSAAVSFEVAQTEKRTRSPTSRSPDRTSAAPISRRRNRRTPFQTRVCWCFRSRVQNARLSRPPPANSRLRHPNSPTTTFSERHFATQPMPQPRTATSAPPQPRPISISGLPMTSSTRPTVLPVSARRVPVVSADQLLVTCSLTRCSISPRRRPAAHFEIHFRFARLQTTWKPATSGCLSHEKGSRAFSTTPWENSGSSSCSSSRAHAAPVRSHPVTLKWFQSQPITALTFQGHAATTTTTEVQDFQRKSDPVSR